MVRGSAKGSEMTIRVFSGSLPSLAAIGASNLGFVRRGAAGIVTRDRAERWRIDRRVCARQTKSNGKMETNSEPLRKWHEAIERIFFRPCGTYSVFSNGHPPLKTVGYYRMSRRDKG